MKIKTQKRLAAQILKCSPKKVRIEPGRLEDVKESITKKDIRALIKDHAIEKVKVNEHSRGHARLIKQQKRKGKRKGHGSRKGPKNSKLTKKDRWMIKVRAIRSLLKELRDTKQIDTKIYHDLYLKTKGGFFRSRRHIMIHLQEHGLIKNEAK